MEIYSKLQVIVIFFNLLKVIASHDYKQVEPNCFSRFDYEYKVLQKLIQLEEANKKLEEEHNELKEAHNDLVEASKARDIEIEDQTSEIRALRSLVNTTQLHDKSDSRAGPVVAFSAYTDADTSVGTKTVFNKVLINEPAAYDQRTGEFTCPVDGIYLFSFVIAVRGVDSTYAKLSINGNVAIEAVAEGREASDDKQGSNVAIVKLEKDDKVWVTGSGTLPGNSHGNSDTRTSSFSGVRLY